MILQSTGMSVANSNLAQNLPDDRSQERVFKEHVMPQRSGNLSTAERTISALTGMLFALLSLRRGNPAVRAVAGVAGAALAARALAGHCGLKSALQGHTSFSEGLADQWGRLTGLVHSTTNGLRGSGAHAARSEANDEFFDQSFRANDGAVSRIPDVPPFDADAKWAAVRAAGGF